MADTNARHRALFEPFQLGAKSLRNRILMTPLSVCYATGDGYVSNQMIQHYGRRAAGGAAMIIVENMAVDTSGRQLPRQALIDGRDRLPKLTELAAEIKREQYAGCYYPRFIAGTTSLSNHSFGTALDLNVPGNLRGTVGEMDRVVVSIFKKWGFAWGGDWRYTDPMHFEMARIVRPG